MTVGRGEIWLADLNPTRGSEQAGVRPVLIFRNDIVSRFSTAVPAIPLTTDLRRASLPTRAQISKGEGGLAGITKETLLAVGGQTIASLCYKTLATKRR
jgi:mRNA interferase MazF